jgi:hypothetical protein
MGVSRSPTLSQVRGWNTDHLDVAAAEWSDAAHVWESAFNAVYGVVENPGGTVWEGSAAEAALARAEADRAKVFEIADAVHGAAAIARSGSSELAAAKQRVLSIVSAAQAAGLEVSDDLSVSADARLWAKPRIAEMQKIAAALHESATSLDAVDRSIAAKLAVARMELENFGFGALPASRGCCGGSFQPLGVGGPPPDTPLLIWCDDTGHSAYRWACMIRHPNGQTDVFYSPADMSGTMGW